MNIVLDYVMIFGRRGFPEMGIEGAALATVIASAFAVAVYVLLLGRRGTRRDVTGRCAGWRFDRALFGRLMRFGLPSGVQFFLDMAGFTFFLLFLGRLGTEPSRPRTSPSTSTRWPSCP